jgi:hypothetical protein
MASDVNTMGGGLSLLELSFDPGFVVEFPSLALSTLTTVKSAIGAKKVLVATGGGFW